MASVELPDGPASLAFINDITERKEAEQKYRDIVEQSPLGIFQSSVNGPLISVNSALAAMFGYDNAEQMINENVSPAQRHARLEDRQELVRAVSESPVSIQREIESRRRDGTTFPTNLYMRAVRAMDGTIQYLEGFVEDITERKRAQEELIRKTALLEAQVDSTLDGILVVDNQGKENPSRTSDWSSCSMCRMRWPVMTMMRVMLRHVTGQTRHPKAIYRAGLLSLCPSG